MNPTQTGIAVALALTVALGFLAFGTPILNSFPGLAPAEDMAAATTTNLTASTTATMEPAFNPSEPLPTELVITDVVIGTGPEATSGSTVTVNYTGMLPDGTVFDSSVGRGPFSFPLGAGQVIRGWDQGVAGMKVGGTRRLVIPPGLAYGEQAVGNVIPANATLVFDVELLGVQ
ncbi:MAG: FKBP-type peptidyl-prolyl cis-trans isomerase [Patescibacteria group bacterium]